MLAEIEDAIVERCKLVIGKHVKTIQDLPGNWDDRTLDAARRNAPGIYVAWSGGRGEGNSRAAISGRYAVYVVTDHASGERARRRGSDREVGAYEILEKIVPALHTLKIDGIGSLQLEQVDNLYSDTADKKGVVIYGAVFSIKMTFPAPLDANDLADFAIFHSISKVPDGPDTEGHLVLPTGAEQQP